MTKSAEVDRKSKFTILCQIVKEKIAVQGTPTNISNWTLHFFHIFLLNTQSVWHLSGDSERGFDTHRTRETPS